VHKSTGPVVHLFIISPTRQAVWIVTGCLDPAFPRSAGATHHDISLLYIGAGLAAFKFIVGRSRIASVWTVLVGALPSYDVVYYSAVAADR